MSDDQALVTASASANADDDDDETTAGDEADAPTPPLTDWQRMTNAERTRMLLPLVGHDVRIVRREPYERAYRAFGAELPIPYEIYKLVRLTPDMLNRPGIALAVEPYKFLVFTLSTITLSFDALYDVQPVEAAEQQIVEAQQTAPAQRDDVQSDETPATLVDAARRAHPESRYGALLVEQALSAGTTLDAFRRLARETAAISGLGLPDDFADSVSAFYAIVYRLRAQMRAATTSEIAAAATRAAQPRSQRPLRPVVRDDDFATR